MEKMMKEKTISHFTHPQPGHVLSLVNDPQPTDFTCELCKIPSKNNLRFKCTICPDFNLDSVCASCDQVTNTFMHPDHILVFNLKPEVATILCSVCNQDIKGGHYSCCDFHAHPLCTKFPEIIKAGMFPAHEDHALKGVFSSDLTTCHVCRTDCAGLRYRCEEEGCDVDFHPPCLTGFGDRDMMGDGDVSGNTRGFRRGLFQVFQGVMLGVDVWGLITTLQGFLF